LTIPLAVVGSQVAHSFAYRFTTPHGPDWSHELAATGHAYLTYAPVVLAVCLLLVVLALAGEVRHLVGRGTLRGATRPRALGFAVSAPAIFVSQEHLERLLHDGAFPWTAVLQPTFVVGLLLQLPFALAAFAIALVLLRAVGSLSRLLLPVRRPRLRAVDMPRPSIEVYTPRVPVLRVPRPPCSSPDVLRAAHAPPASTSKGRS
jgi:hypothetical protein